MIDFPGKLASVVFLGGCNLRCPFCHNPELVKSELLEKQPVIRGDELIENIKKRSNFIEGVTFTGGEPLLYDNLEYLLKNIQNMTDLSIKIDTNGTLPDRLEELLEYVDYISMDIKSSPDKYKIATGGKANFSDIEKSIKFTRNFENYEFRTTLVPGIVDKDDIAIILKIMGGVRRYVIQRFRNDRTLSPEFKDIQPYPEKYLTEAASIAENFAEEVIIR